MKIQDLVPEITPFLDQMERQLVEVVKAKVPEVDKITRYIVQTSGKRIRPALFFIVAGKNNTKLLETLPVATAIELLHAATLVHDDVVDSSGLRRGLPTVNAKWTDAISILAGDYLFAKVFVLLTKYGNQEIINIFANVIEEMSCGEIEQLTDAYNVNLTEDAYIQRCAKKTAAFMSGVCVAGGVVRDADAEEREALHSFGLNLGIAFQVNDDLLDFKSQKSLIGKPVGNDLHQGGITLPIIHLLKHSTRRDYFREEISKRQLNDVLLSELAEAVHESGSLEYSAALARDFTSKAVAALQRVPDKSLRETLAMLANAAAGRHC